MTASLMILLTALAQAAPAPVYSPCAQPCGAGQYCATDGRCYFYPPAPVAPPAPTAAAYPQAPVPPSAQGPSPPSQPYPVAPAYQTNVQQAPRIMTEEKPAARLGPRFGLFLGGLVVPQADVSAAAGGAILTFGSKPVGFETRLQATFAHVEDGYTESNGAVLSFHGTFWWGVYGLGFGSGAGYSDFKRKKSGGWDDGSVMVIAYAAPVMLRFGHQPTFEFGLNAGAARFFSHDVRPYGYLYGGVLF